MQVIIKTVRRIESETIVSVSDNLTKEEAEDMVSEMMHDELDFEEVENTLENVEYEVITN